MGRATIAVMVAGLAGIAGWTAGCGGGDSAASREEARQMVMELGRAIVNNDKPVIEKLVKLDAGIEGVNPVAAAEMETPEGRASMREGNRRFLRLVFRDAAIEDLSALDRFGQSLTVSTSGGSGRAWFEFQKADGKYTEKCILHLQRSDGQWKVAYYDRQLVQK